MREPYLQLKKSQRKITNSQELFNCVHKSISAIHFLKTFSCKCFCAIFIYTSFLGTYMPCKKRCYCIYYYFGQNINSIKKILISRRQKFSLNKLQTSCISKMRKNCTNNMLKLWQKSLNWVFAINTFICKISLSRKTQGY